MILVSWAETPTPNNHSQLMFILTLIAFPVLTFSHTMWSRRKLPDCPVHVIRLPNANHRGSERAGPSCSADQPAPEPRGSVLRTHSFSSPISPSCPQRVFPQKAPCWAGTEPALRKRHPSGLLSSCQVQVRHPLSLAGLPSTQGCY